MGKATRRILRIGLTLLGLGAAIGGASGGRELRDCRGKARARVGRHLPTGGEVMQCWVVCRVHDESHADVLAQPHRRDRGRPDRGLSAGAGQGGNGRLTSLQLGRQRPKRLDDPHPLVRAASPGCRPQTDAVSGLGPQATKALPSIHGCGPRIVSGGDDAGPLRWPRRHRQPHTGRHEQGSHDGDHDRPRRSRNRGSPASGTSSCPRHVRAGIVCTNPASSRVSTCTPATKRRPTADRCR